MNPNFERSAADTEVAAFQRRALRCGMLSHAALIVGALSVMFGLKFGALAAALTFLVCDFVATPPLPWTRITWSLGILWKSAFGYAVIFGLAHFGISGIPAEWTFIFQWAGATIVAVLLVTLPAIAAALRTT